MLRKLMICIGNALVLILLHLLYFNSTWNLAIENDLVMKMTKTENYFAGKGKYKPDDFLFVNTSGDNMLIASPEENQQGNVVITDRKKLAALFKEIADRNNPHRYILCDLLFDLPSPIDSSLYAQLKRIKHIILPSKIDNRTGKTVLPIFNQNHALADYITYDGRLTKMMLWSKQLCEKTLPLKMHEDITGQISEKGKFGLWDHGSYIPYTIYPRYFFRESNIENYRIGLGALTDSLLKNPGSFQKLVDKKILVIGNFSTDSHPTAIGFMPGSLVLLNTFLTIEQGYHYHNIWWFICIGICFSVLAFYELFSKKKTTDKNNRWNIAGHLLKLSVVVTLISMVSFLYFNIHTTIIPVLVYFHGVKMISKYFKSSV